jgi:hypothetical protein
MRSEHANTGQTTAQIAMQRLVGGDKPNQTNVGYIELPKTKRRISGECDPIF